MTWRGQRPKLNAGSRAMKSKKTEAKARPWPERMKSRFLIRGLLSTGAVWAAIIFPFLFITAGLGAYWASSEIYPVHTARHLFSERAGDFLFSLKPLFNLTLFLSFHLSEALGVFPMTGARALFALNGLGIAYMTHVFLRKKQDPLTAALAALALISCLPFLERGFRVRSDLLCSSLCLLSLVFAAKIRQAKPARRGRKPPAWLKLPRRLPALLRPGRGLGSLLAAGGPLAAAALSAPKAVYWLAFSACFAAHELRGRNVFSRLALWQAGSLAGGLFLAASFLFHDPLFLRAIQQAAGFYVKNIEDIFHLAAAESGLFSFFASYSRKLSHFALFAEKAPHIVFLILLKPGFVFWSVFIKKSRKWALSDTAFVFLAGALLLHPQPKIFFITALLPFFLISVFNDPMWGKWRQHGFRPGFLFALLLTACLCAAGAALYSQKNLLSKNSNAPQKRFVQNLNRLFPKGFPAGIYDPLALLYKNAKAYNWFIDSHSSQDLIFEELLEKSRIDIVIPSFLLFYGRLEAWESRSFRFIDVGSQIHYRALVKKLPPVQGAERGSLKGKDLAESLRAARPLPEGARLWHAFLDVSGQITEASPADSAEGQRLLPGRMYSEEEFSRGIIPRPASPEAAFAGVFYLPPPESLPAGDPPAGPRRREKKRLQESPRALFQYDKWL